MPDDEQLPPPCDGDEWERHKLVIAAAVTAAVGNAEIRSVRPVSRGMSWTRQGRMTIQSSHDVSRQRGITRTLPDRGVR